MVGLLVYIKIYARLFAAPKSSLPVAHCGVVLLLLCGSYSGRLLVVNCSPGLLSVGAGLAGTDGGGGNVCM